MPNHLRSSLVRGTHELSETLIAHFQTPNGCDSISPGGIAGFFNTSDDHEALITRPRDLQDNATPSGNAVTITTLLKLAGFTDELRYVGMAAFAVVSASFESFYGS